jgi:hypothetical protein
MLEKEDAIKEDCKDTQHEFYEVESSCTNHWFTKGCCIQPYLSKA